MSSLDDLGRALRADAEANAPRGTDIDLDAVVRSSRARRQPRQWAIGTMVVVATIGIGGASLAALMPPPAMIAASESASDETFLLESDGGATDLGDSRIAGYDCLQPAADPVPTSSPLTLEVRFAPTTVIDDGAIRGEVRMLNASTAPLHVSSDMAPFVTLMQNGLVVWRTPLIGSAGLNRLLAPGESIDFEVQLAAVVCDPEADTWPFDTTGLTSIAPGDYELSATLGVAVEGFALINQVSSPRQMIRVE